MMRVVHLSEQHHTDSPRTDPDLYALSDNQSACSEWYYLVFSLHSEIFWPRIERVYQDVLFHLRCFQSAFLAKINWSLFRIITGRVQSNIVRRYQTHRTIRVDGFCVSVHVCSASASVSPSPSPSPFVNTSQGQVQTSLQPGVEPF